MINYRPYFFFAMVLLFTACTAVEDRQMEESINYKEQIPQGRIIIQVSEEAADKLEDSTLAIPDNYIFRKAIEGDPGFERRHREAGLHRWYYAEPAEEITSTKAVADLTGIADHIEFIPEEAPDSAIPFNDPSFPYQWHLYNNGTLAGGFSAGADINVIPVWENFTAGNNEVVVGVVDTGVQHDHPDLEGVVIPAGSDGSRSFLNTNILHPYDYTPQRHGTHVAGIIAAINNNGAGGCGIAGGNDGTGGVRILDCQAIASAEGETGDVFSAIVWAADHGAVLLNNSWNLKYESEDKVPTETPSFYSAVIDYFIQNAGTDSHGNQTGPMKGGVVFFSAGNNSWQKSQPSMYDNVIAVGATGPAGEASSFTNYGDWVDICAPGGNYSPYGTYNAIIYSTVSDSGYAQMQGTSQACPMACGVAALLVSHFGGDGFTNKDLTDLLIGGADKEKAHSVNIGPALDAYESFAFRSREMEPADDIDVSLSKSSATISWTARSCDGEKYFAYKVLVSEDENALKNPDIFNPGNKVRTRTVTNPGMARKCSTVFYQLDSCTNYYCTAAGYTRSHNYNRSNQTVKFRINGSPSIHRENNERIVLHHNQNIDVVLRYADPDGDILTVNIVSDNKPCTWDDDGSGTVILHLSGLSGAGEHVVRISVSDQEKEALLDVPFTVLENSPVSITSAIQDIVVPAGTSSATLNLLDYFKDDDDDEIVFSATSNDTSVTVFVSSAVMTLGADGLGIARIDVTAEDGIGEAAKTSFNIRFQDDPSGISIGPDRVSDALTISTSTKEKTKVQIFSSTGRKLVDSKISTSPFEQHVMDVTGLSPGRYIITAETSKCKIKKTIVKI